MGDGGGELSSTMPPPPPRTRKRKEIVLEEEEWIARMDAIIRRDYFPELASLESKVEWLEALRSKDPERLEQAQLRLIACQHPESARSSGASPWGVAPQSERGEHDRPSSSRPSKPQSLDAFLASYTSEDNSSFRSLLDAANARRAAKNKAFFKAPDPTLRGREHQPLLDAQHHHRLLNLPGVPDEQEDSDALRGSRHTPMNALMFRQGSESFPLTPSELGRRGSAWSATAPSIAVASTRFAGGESGSGLSTALSTPGSGRSAVPRRGAERIFQFGSRPDAPSSVLATPVLDPDADGPAPPVTWGALAGTPLRLGGEEEPGSRPGSSPAGYSIAETPAREVRARALARRGHRGSGASRAGPATALQGVLISVERRRREAVDPGGGGSGPAGARQMPLSAAGRRLARRLGADGAGLDAQLRARYGTTPARLGGSRRGTPAQGWDEF